MARIHHWTKYNAADLWHKWLHLFEGDEGQAIVTAIFIANRLVKGKAKSTRIRFYSIKEEFIRRNQPNLVMGQRVREETQVCWGCDEEGYDIGGYTCPRCGGTGIYRSRILYTHKFVIQGQPYSFHSYEKPVRLVDEWGEDLESYGGKFNENELSELALPMTGFLKILSYVAAAKWNMYLNRNRYYPQPERHTNQPVVYQDHWQEKLHRWMNGLPTPG